MASPVDFSRAFEPSGVRETPFRKGLSCGIFSLYAGHACFSVLYQDVLSVFEHEPLKILTYPAIHRHYDLVTIP